MNVYKKGCFRLLWNSKYGSNKNLEFYKLNIGQVTNVLFERTRSEGLITGFTSNYIRVEYPWHSKLAGQIKKVKLNTISPSGRMNTEIIS